MQCRCNVLCNRCCTYEDSLAFRLHCTHHRLITVHITQVNNLNFAIVIKIVWLFLFTGHFPAILSPFQFHGIVNIAHFITMCTNENNYYSIFNRRGFTGGIRGMYPPKCIQKNGKKQNLNTLQKWKKKKE